VDTAKFLLLFRSVLTPSRLQQGKSRLTSEQPRATMPSPNSDTRAQVVVAYQGHQVFVCAQCATVIVRVAFIGPVFELIVAVVLQLTGTPGRADQQGIFRPRWARIVSILVLIVAPRDSNMGYSLMQSATNIKLASKEERALLCVRSRSRSGTYCIHNDCGLTLRVQNRGTHGGGCSLSRL
jgi:hypothetical protein